jgi:nucleoside-diphosphate-sugar epimerase
LVTGVAGFIGSQLAERLVSEQHSVVGVDCFVPYYRRTIKEWNLRTLNGSPLFEFRELDLRTDELNEVLDDVQVIYHLAAMPGLAASWTDFDLYMNCNLLATHRLVAAARSQRSLRAFVQVSTSSVYGRDALGDEQQVPHPVSPYGVTKLAAERLALAYHEAYGLPAVVLRYFSVYGPRQRPDMGIHIFIDKILRGETIRVFGDGEQTRGATFVDDCVTATLLAADRCAPGDVLNIGGGEAQSVNWIIDTLGELIGRAPAKQFMPKRAGDQAHTLADTTRAQKVLGFQPCTSLRDGLAAQIRWQRDSVSVLGGALAGSPV